ncbi:MAG: hypothetical protein ACOX4K_03485 [Bacillota bacterium]
MRLNMTNNGMVNPLNTQRALQRQPSGTEGQSVPQGPAFLEALKEAQRGTDVTFSRHAEQRLSAWNQGTKSDYMGQLNSAMNIAQAKGARSTLVLMEGVAFLVAPQNRTVVTVIPEDRMKDNLFTSIDSAVVMNK